MASGIRSTRNQASHFFISRSWRNWSSACNFTCSFYQHLMHTSVSIVQITVERLSRYILTSAAMALRCDDVHAFCWDEEFAHNNNCLMAPHHQKTVRQLYTTWEWTLICMCAHEAELSWLFCPVHTYTHSGSSDSYGSSGKMLQKSRLHDEQLVSSDARYIRIS